MVYLICDAWLGVEAQYLMSKFQSLWLEGAAGQSGDSPIPHLLAACKFNAEEPHELFLEVEDPRLAGHSLLYIGEILKRPFDGFAEVKIKGKTSGSKLV